MGFIAIPWSLLVSSITHITGTHLQTHTLTDKSRRQRDKQLYIIHPVHSTASNLLYYFINYLLIGLNAENINLILKLIILIQISILYYYYTYIIKSVFCFINKYFVLYMYIGTRLRACMCNILYNNNIVSQMCDQSFDLINLVCIVQQIISSNNIKDNKDSND